MSIVNIVYHDENIYSVANKEEEAIPKPPRYHSKFENMVREERKIVMKDHKTMGFAEVPLRCTKHFLRKDSGVKCEIPTSPRQCVLSARKPPVPKGYDLCKCETSCEKSCRNFRLENIKRVVSAKPKKHKPKYCDTKNGDLHDLEKSGLVPIYLTKSKFGKCPEYLVKRQNIHKNMEQIARDEELEKQHKCRYITPENRAKLLGGLKENWEELQKNYQALPLLIDTIPKMIRKTKLENALKSLERDILLVENNPHIYIYDE